MGCLIPGLSWYPRHVSCLRLAKASASLSLLITKQIRRSDTALKYPAFLPPLRWWSLAVVAGSNILLSSGKSVLLANRHWLKEQRKCRDVSWLAICTAMDFLQLRIHEHAARSSAIPRWRARDESFHFMFLSSREEEARDSSLSNLEDIQRTRMKHGTIAMRTFDQMKIGKGSLRWSDAIRNDRGGVDCCTMM